MNFDLPPKVEQISKNKERLLRLEKEGKYVFHGSPEILSVLNPYRGSNLNRETGKMVTDVEPVVCATPYAETAIFRSLINGNYVEGESENGFGIDDDHKLHFSATRNLLDRAKCITGRIYVLSRESFDIKEGKMECRSSEPVIPIEVMDVTFNDLPKNIRIIDTKNI